MNRLHTITIEVGTIIPLTQSGVSACVACTSYITCKHNITYKQVIDDISAIVNRSAAELLQSSRIATFNGIDVSFACFYSSIPVILARTDYTVITKLYADITEKLQQTQIAIANIDKTISSLKKDLDTEVIAKTLSYTTDCTEYITVCEQKESVCKYAEKLRTALEKKLHDYTWQLSKVSI